MNHAPGLRGLLSLVLPAALLAMAASDAGSETGRGEKPRSCPGGAATVIGASKADFADICSGVAGSLKFLGLHGVRPTEPVSIEVTTGIQQATSATAAGSYVEQKRRVFVVPYQVFRANKTWFGVAIGRETYRALAAHETAHAVMARNFRIPEPTIQAKEYLAYVAMFAVMSAELRTQVWLATPTEGFTSLDRFTALLYMFDPMRFGAEASLHFSRAPDQTALIQDVLAGKLLSEWQLPLRRPKDAAHPLLSRPETNRE